MFAPPDAFTEHVMSNSLPSPMIADPDSVALHIRVPYYEIVFGYQACFSNDCVLPRFFALALLV
jgi:hypothetical protein